MSNKEVEKLQTHLSLLRHQYVRLQEKCTYLEQKLALLTASTATASLSASDQDSFPQHLLKFISSLYEKEEYSDLVIRLREGQIRVHKFVLASRGNFWGVASLANVDSLDWMGFEEGVGTCLLKWLYTDCVQLTNDAFTQNLVKVASQFQLRSLVKRCEEALIGSVSLFNCIQLYTVAEEIAAEALKAHCSALISNCWDDFSPEDFRHMSAPLLYSMIKSKTKLHLHEVVKLHREDVLFLYLIENDSQLSTLLNQCNETGKLALEISLEEKQWNIASTLLQHGASVNVINGDGYSILHNAVLRGDDSVAKFLIDNDADINEANEKSNQIPLHVIAATSYKDTETSLLMSNIAKIMLDRGVNPNSQDKNMITALHLAVKNGNYELFKILLTSPGIQLNIKDEMCLPPLWYALSSSFEFSDNSFAALLIENGALVDEELENGNTLLHLVSRKGLEEAGLFLTAKGASPSQYNTAGESPLHLACTVGLPSLTTALLEYGADANWQTFAPSPISNRETLSFNVSNDDSMEESQKIEKQIFKETPLHRAIRHKNIDDAMAILSYNGEMTLSVFSELSLNLQDSEGLTCLGAAVTNGYLSLAQAILEKGADVNQTDDEGRSLLHRVLEHNSENSIQLARFLIKNGIDINQRTFNGYSPLHICIRNGISDVAEILSKNGADTKSMYPDSQDPLLWHTFIFGHRNIAEILIRHDIDVDSWASGPEQCMETLLHRAIDENKEDFACFLIQNGASVNVIRRQNAEGLGAVIARELQTPLHMCCSWGLVETATTLLQFGGEINARDYEGKTPLHIALENNHSKLVELLLEHPSLDLGLRDHKGMSAFSVAMTRKNNKAAQSILQKFPPAAEQYDNKGLNYLHTAIQKKDLESVLFLLSIHVNIGSKTKDEFQFTPLHLATLEGNEMIVRNLLLAGANIQDLTPRKETCLHLCSLHDHYALAVIFIQNGITVDNLDSNLNNALHVAVKEGYLSTVRVLLTESQINAGAINLRGQNPLHVLAAYPKENAGAIAQLFLEALPHYPINNVDVDGNTALLLAYMNGSGQLCRILVRSGACLGTANKQGIHLFNYEVATKALLRRLLDAIAEEPPWSEGETCLECSTKFGLATRRHHCRHCGRILCAKCSGKEIPILKFGINKPVRVCQLCFDVLTLGPSGSG